jgi:DinB superfamily
MYDVPTESLTALRATPTILRRLLAGLTQDHAGALRGGDEGWSILEVVCHLRDAEERALERMRSMRDMDEPRIAGYDQEAWARERRYADDDLQAACDAFLEHRRRHIAELEALEPAAWERAGLHDEQGRVTIASHTLHIAAHDATHLAQIARQYPG